MFGKRKLIMFIIMLLIAGSLFISTAFGELDIAIYLSDGCIELNKIDSLTCPRYYQLLELDNSIPIVSGEFVWNGQDTYREYNGKHNTYRYYDIIPEQTTFLDPPPITAYDRLIQIHITPNVSWHDDDNTYKYLYIHNCREVYLGPELGYYPVFITYLIEYMNNGCTEPHLHSAYSTPREQPDYEWIWDGSPAVQQALWYEKAKRECKQKC